MANKRFLPLGIDPKRERNGFLVLLALAAAFSLIWFFALYESLQGLYEYDYKTASYVLREGMMMPRFIVVLDYAMHGFLALAFASLLRIAQHYAYYRQGSRSIYLMRRLPDRFELHRRCLTVPLTEAAITLLLAALLFLLYFAIYTAVTPEPCLIPNQWMAWFGLS